MIHLRSPEEIKAIERAGRIIAETIKHLMSHVQKGITSGHLDVIAEEFIRSKGGKPAFKGYRGFPASICTSFNEEVVHGIPSGRKLKEGDILSIDLGVEKDGFFADAAVTLGVGRIEESAQRLIKITQKALVSGISRARIGKRISDISHCIQQTAESEGFSVVKEFVGHGIGTHIHEEPAIPNYGSPHRGPRLKAGMILAIEPMLCAGSWKVDVLKDGWTAVTRDRKLSAHFEHTVAVTNDGPKVLTLWQKKNLL